MNIVLTGCTGFIGHHLAKALHLRGHHVVGLVRPSSNPERLKALQAYAHLLCIPEQTHTLAQALAAHQPQMLIHLAAHYEGQHQAHTLGPMLHSNLVFATQVLDACVQAGVRQFINTGTSWQHHHTNPDAYRPVNLYAASKQAFEAMLAYYTEHHQVKAITLKLFDTYGPEDHRRKLFYALRKAALEGNTLQMSPGEQLLDLVFIQDIVDGFLVAMEHITNSDASKPCHESFFLGSGQCISLRNLVNCYKQIVKKNLQVEWGALPYRIREVMIPTDPLPLLPGWQAKVSLHQGIIITETDPSSGGLLSVI